MCAGRTGIQFSQTVKYRTVKKSGGWRIPCYKTGQKKFYVPCNVTRVWKDDNGFVMVEVCDNPERGCRSDGGVMSFRTALDRVRGWFWRGARCRRPGFMDFLSQEGV